MEIVKAEPHKMLLELVTQKESSPLTDILRTQPCFRAPLLASDTVGCRYNKGFNFSQGELKESWAHLTAQGHQTQHAMCFLRLFL